MILKQKCEECAFGNKCLAKAKLKAFSAEAKVDLGVTLEFKDCEDFKAVTKVTTSEDNEEEE